MRSLLLALMTLLASPALADFPLRLPHGLGTLALEAPPERVLPLGWITPDVLVALGMQPVALPRQSWGGDANGLMPWMTEALDARGWPVPPLVDDGYLSFEALLTHHPDAILAPMSGITPRDYARLSQIAPTLGWTGAPWTGSWQGVTRQLGDVLDRPAQAEALIARTEERLAAAARPDFAGLTFLIGSGNPSAGTISLHRGDDPRVQLLEALGLTLAPDLAGAPGAGFQVTLGFEALSRLDADLLILWQSGPEELADLSAHPVFAAFGPVARGCVLPMLDRGFVMATSAPSPLSIPWALDRLVPALTNLLAAHPACR